MPTTKGSMLGITGTNLKPNIGIEISVVAITTAQ